MLLSQFFPATTNSNDEKEEMEESDIEDSDLDEMNYLSEAETSDMSESESSLASTNSPVVILTLSISTGDDTPSTITTG